MARLSQPEAQTFLKAAIERRNQEGAALGELFGVLASANAARRQQSKRASDLEACGIYCTPLINDLCTVFVKIKKMH